MQKHKYRWKKRIYESINSGNCKFRNYFFKINGKVLHIKERFENIGKSKRRRDILKYIIKNLRVL